MCEGHYGYGNGWKGVEYCCYCPNEVSCARASKMSLEAMRENQMAGEKDRFEGYSRWRSEHTRSLKDESTKPKGAEADAQFERDMRMDQVNITRAKKLRERVNAFRKVIRKQDIALSEEEQEILDYVDTSLNESMSRDDWQKLNAVIGILWHKFDTLISAVERGNRVSADISGSIRDIRNRS
jgi:hypothetical protein